MDPTLGHLIQTICEAIIAVCAAYTALRSHINGLLTQEVKQELKDNPTKCVEEMVKQNGGLSGVFPKCSYVPPKEKIPGE